MQVVLVTFFGTVCEKGFIIGEMLLERRIQHEFVLLDDLILSIQDIRDVEGFDRIKTYLERYEYIADLWR